MGVEVLLVVGSRPDFFSNQVRALTKHLKEEFHIVAVERAMWREEAKEARKRIRQTDAWEIPAEQSPFLRRDTTGYTVFQEGLKVWLAERLEKTPADAILYLEHDVWPVEDFTIAELVGENGAAGPCYGGGLWPNFVALLKGESVEFLKVNPHMTCYPTEESRTSVRIGPFVHEGQDSRQRPFHNRDNDLRMLEIPTTAKEVHPYKQKLVTFMKINGELQQQKILKARKAKLVDGIGTTLHHLIRDRYGNIPCGSCRAEITRLDGMTPEQVRADSENIVTGIVSRLKQNGAWWQRFISAVAPDFVVQHTHSLLEEAVKEVEA